MQGHLFPPESDWTPPNLGTLPSWAEAKRVAVDVETHDEHLKTLGIGVRRGGYITGVSFAIEDGPKHYLPIAHAAGGNLDKEKVLQYLKDQSRVFKGILVGANLSYDLDYLWEAGVMFDQVEYFRDIQIADPLIYELHQSFSLQAIAERYGLPGKDEVLLREAAEAYRVDPKNGMWSLHSKYVGPYAQEDAAQPLLILRRQERVIEEEELWPIFNLESKVLPVLVRMRRRGVRIDLDKLDEVERYSIVEEQKALDIIKNLTGVKIALGDVWSPEPFVPVLQHLGIKIPKTEKTGKDSIDKALLVSAKRPETDAILRARKTNKLRTTFVESIRRYMVNGRIHCTFNQIAREKDDEEGEEGARFGRLSAVKPNLQQQPSRDEFAKFWRSIYIPEEGKIWACNDFSQQEPRWTTHAAAQLDLPGAREAARRYREDPKMDNHDMMTELIHERSTFTKKERDAAKNIFLGICYGEGGAKMCKELGLPTRWAVSTKNGREFKITYFEKYEDARKFRAGNETGYIWEAAGEKGQEIMDKFNEKVPYVRALAKRAERKAKQFGIITTYGGRKLHFEQRPDGTYEFTHKALNRFIQGSSADQVKMAMVEVDKAGHFMQLQVHDEIDSSVQNLEEAKAIADIMSSVVQAQVPFKVDIEIGPSWGEIDKPT